MAARNIDWESVQVEYRAGQLSVRTIAHEYGITEGAVRKRAKRDNWERNLADRIKDRIREKMVRGTHKVRTPQDNSEETIVEAAATRTLQFVDVHRVAAKKHRENIDKLFCLMEKKLAANHIDVHLLKDLSIICKSLVGSMATLISIERKAYGLDDKKYADRK